MRISSPFLKNFIMNINIIIPVFLFLVFVLSVVQIYVLKKDTMMAIVHSLLISGLISF